MMNIKSKTVMCAMLMFSMLAGAEEAKNVDPWEGWNRKVFAFNDALDRFLLRPVAKGFRFVTPDPVEHGVARMFNNLGEILNTFNDVLQGKFGQAGNDSGRFLVNTTLGLVGFFDVADRMGLSKSEGEDFGQTLGFWKVNSGPYLVLPLLGPSNLRDAPSQAVDLLLNPVFYIDDVVARNTIYGISVVSDRAELLDTEELIKGDKYTFIRDAYLQRRQYLVSDGEVEDDFGEFDNY